MPGLLITGASVFSANGVIENGAVLVDEGRITHIGPAAALAHRAAPGHEVIDGHGHLLLPGFIDLQVNGAGGRLFTGDPSQETLTAMSTALASTGCTAFLPTVISAPLDQMARAASAAAQATPLPQPGARVLGSHLEGPFLNPARSGAHQRSHLRLPNQTEIHSLLDSGEGTVRLTTLAPELPGASALIAEAAAHGCAIAIGHTEATAEDTAAVVEAGATLVTHLFNAMPPLQARAPGVAGAALAGVVPFATLITDGIHAHPLAVASAVRAMGTDRVILVTDAMPPVATELREFDLQSRRVLVRDGACYLEDGTLSGSILTMNKAVHNMLRMTGVSLPEAVGMASANPARALGIDNRKGSLAQGMDADLVLCTTDLDVLLTAVEGHVVYRSPLYRNPQPTAAGQ
ncbi:MAG: N-acetylglucosamine-6-phosphate deacetylase [Dehalococcoidia bacterium]